MELIMSHKTHLKKTLTALHIWAMGVGLVISGDYFGWNYGLITASPVIMLLVVAAVGLFYLSFIFCYTELVAMVPNSGGPFSFVSAAFGHKLGVVAGAVTLIEFLFAPPAIGSFVHYVFPVFNAVHVTVAFFIIFGILNFTGVAFAATLELIVTLIASLVLVIFFGTTLPHVNIANILSSPALESSVFSQIYSALPFAIWFFLGIEGVAMCVEEVKNPEKAIPRGLITAIITLLVFALTVIICSTGILPSSVLVSGNDALPKVLAAISSSDSWLTLMMIYLGIFGLIASFHGIIFGASRQVFALSRARLLPRVLSYIAPKLLTPVNSIILCCAIGVICALSNQTAVLVSISGLGAVFVYALSLAAFIKLKLAKKDAHEHSFNAPFFPLLPIVTLLLAVLICGLMLLADVMTSLIFLAALIIICVFAAIMYFLHKDKTIHEDLH
jgi:ethanolamine permease